MGGSNRWAESEKLPWEETASELSLVTRHLPSGSRPCSGPGKAGRCRSEWLGDVRGTKLRGSTQTGRGGGWGIIAFIPAWLY